MDPYFKLFITILSIVLTIIFGCRIKDKRKRTTVIMLILLGISLASNKSIYWILYWDGPYRGQVVDADTGNPIEGAAVAGIWGFEYIHIKSSIGFANAKETVTDAGGKFWLPVIFAFSPWPFTVLDRMDLVVFKPGYDSHPPSKQMAWTTVEKNKYGMTNHEYRVKFTVKCKMWKKCLVRLNKAITLKERQEAYAEIKGEYPDNPKHYKKIKNIIKLVETEARHVKVLIRNKRLRRD